jgi:hypothetical protein
MGSLIFAGAGIEPALNLNPPNLHLPNRWDYRVCTTMFGLFIEIESYFLPKMALNLDPPNLHFPSSWDYRHDPQHPVKTTLKKYSY